MILVAGGTGLLGSRLVPDLVGDGQRVRVLARGVHPFPVEWPDTVEHVAGDLASPADCQRAVEGCAKVVFAASGFGLPKEGDPRSVDRDGAIRLTRADRLPPVQVRRGGGAEGVGHGLDHRPHGRPTRAVDRRAVRTAGG